MAEKEVRSMILSFRLLELQALLTFAGKSKLGKKNELQNRALELLSAGDKSTFNKIKELSNAMYKQLGSSPSQSQNCEEKEVNDKSISDTNSEIRLHPTTRAHGHNSRLQQTNDETQEEPLELTVHKATSSDKTKQTKKQPKTAPILQQKKLQQGKPNSSKALPSNNLKRSKAKNNSKGKSQMKKQKEKIVITSDITDGRRPRRGAAIAASAAMMAQKVLDKQLSSANVAFSDESSSDDEVEAEDEDENENEGQTSNLNELEHESIPKKKTQNKNKKKQTPKKPNTTNSKQSNTTKETTTNSRKGDSNSSGKQNEKPVSNHNKRPHNSGSNIPFATGIGNTLGSSGSVSTGSSVYGYGGLPIAPPPNGNSANFMATHVPPAQRAGPYIPYFPQAIKPSPLVYPTFADVKLRKLPFYEVMATLLKPSSLQPQGTARFQEQSYSFHLTPQQVSAIEQSGYRDSQGRPDYKKQIQVNGRLQPLPNPIPTNKPGIEPKRPPKAINVTGLCKLSSTSPNYINVSWTVEVGRGYTVSVYFVEKLSSQDLLQKLKSKGQRHPDYTRAVIKDKLNDVDNEIATTSCKVSLACPLGKMRMRMPCRSSKCDHLQCFDANFYLMMNEKKDKWMCPVCNNPAPFDTLMLDGFFSEMITSRRLPDDEHEIVLHNDASWDPLPPKIPDHLRPQSPPRAKVSKKVETLSVDDDDDSSVNAASNDMSTISGSGISSHQGSVNRFRPSSNKSVECVTLDSDSDDGNEEIMPPASKIPRRTNAFIDEDSDSCNTITPTSSSSNTVPSPNAALHQAPIPPLHEAHQALVALADAAAASLQKEKEQERQGLDTLTSKAPQNNVMLAPNLHHRDVNCPPPLICLDDDDD